MCRLLNKNIIKDTKNNRMKNDCPSQCDKTHCDVCQFTDNKKVVTVKDPSPEIYGREMYYQVESSQPQRGYAPACKGYSYTILRILNELKGTQPLSKRLN